MKLLYCANCQDVFKLNKRLRYCECGKTAGQYYDDGINAWYSGVGMPIGFNNVSLALALQKQPEQGLGETFVAFVIPAKCSSFEKH